MQLFAEAQKLAPSKSGALKRSGTFKLEKNNIVISYSEPYAFTLHEGEVKGAVIGDPGRFPWKADTREHVRRVGSGRVVNVRRHTKTYKPYYKPTKSAGGWKAINYQAASNREGTKWVQKAWDNVRRNQPRDLRNVLPRILIITA
tara:strand:+ start:122 stop:556 length:435 start_codon:yes stop_codon:yes gene_type:complete